MPLLETRLAIEGRAQGRCLMGASFGAVASFTTAWRRPGMFGKLLLQSGSFAFTDIGDRNHRGPLFDPIVQFMNKFRADPQPVSERIFISVGTYESLIYENRSLVPLLRGTGMEVRYTEARDEQLGELARSAAGGPVVAIPGTAAARLRVAADLLDLRALSAAATVVNAARLARAMPVLMSGSLKISTSLTPR